MIEGFNTRTLMLLSVVAMLVLSVGCGGGGAVTPDPVTEPEVQSMNSSAAGDVSATFNEQNLTVAASVRDANGNPLNGIQVGMVATNDAVVLSTYDPSGEYYPSLRVVPHASTSALKGSSQHVRIEAWLVLSEAGEGMAGISFYEDPPIFNLNWVEPGVVTVMAGVDVAAQVVIPLGGVITLKNQMPDGSYKLLNLYFGKDWTLAGVVEKLAEYLDITRDYTIKTHPLFPRYAEIATGKTGEMFNLPPDVTYELLANGDTATGDVADVTVTNTSETDYRLIIIPGTTFENANTDHQDMTCIETVVVLIAPGQTVCADVFGACVHRHKAGPQEGDVLTPFRDQRWDLVKLCIVIDEVDPRDGVLQDAIWVITDDNPPKVNNRDEVIQLFLAAGLNPDDYPALADHDGGSGGEI